MYQELRNVSGGLLSIVRLSDNAQIPVADDNADYQQYLQWVAQGNAPAPDSAWTPSATPAI